MPLASLITAPDDFLSVVPHSVVEQEHGLMSKLFDNHYNLVPRSSIDSYLAGASAVLSKGFHHVFGGDSSELLENPIDNRHENSEPVDVLYPQNSLNMPPEEEQALLRHTLNAGLKHKIDLAKYDLDNLTKFKDLFVKENKETGHSGSWWWPFGAKETSTDPVSEALQIRSEPEPAFTYPDGKFETLKMNGLKVDKVDIPDVSNPDKEWFIWKAYPYQRVALMGPEEKEPLIVTHDDSWHLQLVPLRSALAYADNRELFYRAADGTIHASDESHIVAADSDGRVALRESENIATKHWNLEKNGTMTDDNDNFLQFPGVPGSILDSRYIEPLSATSNVVGSSVNSVLDHNPSHTWEVENNTDVNPYVVIELSPNGPAQVEEVNLDFSQPPKEFLVSGSSDAGHSWEPIFGTDLNNSENVNVAVNGMYTHVKVTMLQPLEGANSFGLRHVGFLGKMLPQPFVGGYPLFGPVGHFELERLRGPLPIPGDKETLFSLNQQIELEANKLVLAEEKFAREAGLTTMHDHDHDSGEGHEFFTTHLAHNTPAVLLLSAFLFFTQREKLAKFL